MLKLADFLRKWAKETVISGNDIAIRCKFCLSDQVVKNGLRKNTQTWLCKNCGHSFTDNHALPKMRYPAFTIASAVHDYYDGYSIRQICGEIEKATGILPSSSTIHGWIKRLTEKALSTESGYHPSVGDSWIVYKTPLGIKNTNFWLMNIIDVDTRFLLATRLLKNIDERDIRGLILSAAKKAGKKPKAILTNIGKENLHRVYTAVEAEFNGIRVISITDRELNDSFEHIIPNMIKNRLKPISNVDINDNDINPNSSLHAVLNGFIFHHNYISPQKNSLDIPAEAAGITFPFKDWINILESETLP